MFDKYILYIAVFSCTFAIFAYIYKILRLLRKIEVNCWFCNKNSKVEYKFLNCFICPFCEQYNGFREDGDYNCIIPAQHLESYNFSPRQPLQNTSSSKEDSTFHNGFCEPCNFNQALKIRAIADFSSVSTNDSDEVDKFRDRLEEIYGLCQQCQAILHQTLGKQNSWLKPQFISWRLMKTKEKVLKSPFLKKKKSCSWKIFHQVSTIVCLIMCLLSIEKYVSSFQPFKIDFEKNFGKLSSTYCLLLCFGIVLQSCLVFFQDRIWKIRNIASFSGWSLLFLIERWTDSFSAKNVQHLKLFCNFFNTLFVFWFSRMMLVDSTPLQNMSNRRKKADVSKERSFSTNSIRNGDLLESKSSSLAAGPKEEDGDTASVAEEELDADLLSLKISTPKKSDSKMFCPQNLFRENSSNKTKLSQHVVQPSKFGKHFITQASWVAGGYWGSPGSPQRGRLTSQNVSHLDEAKPKALFSLSRSSSQSSGFVSQFSESAPLKSHHNFYPNLQKQSHSQQSSLAGEAPIERASLCSWGGGGGGSCANGVPSFHSVSSFNADPLEAQSACSASSSSFYSDNSQRLHGRPSSQFASCYHDTNLLLGTSSLPESEAARHVSAVCKGSLVHQSYFNLGVAFILGISVSANIFLVGILSQHDFFGK